MVLDLSNKQTNGNLECMIKFSAVGSYIQGSKRKMNNNFARVDGVYNIIFSLV